MQQRLIIYAKRPLPGYAKTRLGTCIGSEQAAGVYARMLFTYLSEVICERLPDTTIELATASTEDCAYFEAAFPELTVRPQIRGDLGVRMYDSFQQAFRGGAKAVVLTGSDIPDLNANLIRRAFTQLHRQMKAPRLPGVIGPAVDGGYYLLGLCAPGANLFENIAWSSGTVLTDTEARAADRDVELAYLPRLSDVDHLDDYRAWAGRLRASHLGLAE